MVSNVLKLKELATDIRPEDLTNHSESRSFVKTALVGGVLLALEFYQE